MRNIASKNHGTVMDGEWETTLKHRKIQLLVLLFCAIIFGCQEVKVPAQITKEPVASQRIEENRLSDLSGRKIYFGHQSVGFNIVDGLNEVLMGYPSAKFKIQEFAPNSVPPEGHGISHSKVGKNRFPLEKIESFKRNVLGENTGKQWEIAFMKFCYVDFYEETNVGEIFDAYKKGIAEIQAQRPNILLVHMTVPLTTGDTTFKEWVKSKIGRGGSEKIGNIQRNRFNKLMRAEYGKSPFLFDLAMYESTRKDGSRTTFTDGDIIYERLSPEYSDDGGHLNGKGRVWVGGELLYFLSGIPRK